MCFYYNWKFNFRNLFWRIFTIFAPYFIHGVLRLHIKVYISKSKTVVTRDCLRKDSKHIWLQKQDSKLYRKKNFFWNKSHLLFSDGKFLSPKIFNCYTMGESRGEHWLEKAQTTFQNGRNRLNVLQLYYDGFHTLQRTMFHRTLTLTPLHAANAHKEQQTKSSESGTESVLLNRADQSYWFLWFV